MSPPLFFISLLKRLCLSRFIGDGYLGFLKLFNKRVKYEFGSFTRREMNSPEVFASRTSLDYCKQMFNFELGSKDARGRTTLFEVNI